MWFHSSVGIPGTKTLVVNSGSLGGAGSFSPWLGELTLLSPTTADLGFFTGLVGDTSLVFLFV